MKCPKCGYLGFESGDRCRNCGYEFSLSVADSPIPLDLTLDPGPDEAEPPLDLDRIIGAPEPDAAGRPAAVHAGAAETQPLSSDAPRLRLRADDAPLVGVAAARTSR